LQDGVNMATQPTDTAKPRLRTASDELTIIAQRAQAFTNASGTAIALSEGNADEIVCRARSGAVAPEVGTALRVEGSFTGLCIQSGKELRCDDAETDTRVDMAAIRALGIRSMVVTPIRNEGRVIGVLACFAPTAHAFTITHVAVLKTMADQITVLLQKERRAQEGGPASAPVATPEVPAPQTATTTPAPPPVVIKPVTANGSSHSAPVRSPLPAVAKVEPLASIPLTIKEEKKPEVRASFGTFDAVAAEDKKSSLAPKLLGAIAVLVVAGGVTFAFLKMHKPAAPAPAQQAQETVNPTTTTEPAQPQQAQRSEANTVTASVPVNASEHLPSASGAGNTNSASHAAAKESVAVSARSSKKSQNVPEPENVVEPAEKAPATVALSSGPSQIRTNTSGQQAPVVAPLLSVGSGNPAGALSALAHPVGAAPTATLARSELESVKFLKTVPPVYPPLARIRAMSGEVVIEVTVGKDGKAHNPKLVSGQPIFRDAAFDAVKQWVFKPAKLNGEAVEQVTRIKMGFHP
jgi:TonB family protein